MARCGMSSVIIEAKRVTQLELVVTVYLMSMDAIFL